MLLGVIVEGVSEFQALPKLLSRVKSTHRLLNPILVDMHPHAAATNIATKAKKQFPLLRERGAKGILILIDREDSQVCCGERAGAIRAAVYPHLSQFGFSECFVVLKDRSFENWLIADQEAFSSLKARFNWPRSLSNVDRLDADSIIKRSIKGGAYNKTVDAIRIMSIAEPRQMALTSRSFRKFLGVVGDPLYNRQTARVARPNKRKQS